MVIELLETIACDCKTLEAARKMVKAGYRIALDDYVHDESMLPLVDLACIVKIDVLNRPFSELRTLTNELRKSHVRSSPNASNRRRCAMRAPRWGVTCFRATCSASPKC